MAKNKKPRSIIKDWAGNICFGGKDFKDFDDAESFLCEKLNDDYETDRQEYFIVNENEL